jgi:hypothetical protein
VATTPATLLAQQHRTAQARLADALAAIVAARWRLTVRAPGQGTDQFIERAVVDIRRAATTSTTAARIYYGRARALDLPDADRVQLEAQPLVDEQLVAGLVASGMKHLSDALEAGKELGEALEEASSAAQGSSVRLALLPARQMIRTAHTQDDLALGWYRVTANDDRVCFFCAALASRGAVYRSDSFSRSDPRFSGDGEVKVHDRCRCTFAPLFTSGADLPDSVTAMRDAWTLASTPFSGNEKLTAFRRYWEALQRGEDEVLALARAHRDRETVARLRGSRSLDPTEEVA